MNTEYSDFICSEFMWTYWFVFSCTLLFGDVFIVNTFEQHMYPILWCDKLPILWPKNGRTYFWRSLIKWKIVRFCLTCDFILTKYFFSLSLLYFFYSHCNNFVINYNHNKENPFLNNFISIKQHWIFNVVKKYRK